MRISNQCSNTARQDSAFETFQKKLLDKGGLPGKSGQAGRSGAGGACGMPGQDGRSGAKGKPIPVEPDGGIGDGAGPLSCMPGDKEPEATTLAIGEEDGGKPIPVEPDGGIGDGAGPISCGSDDGEPEATTFAIGEEDGGADGGVIMGTRGNDFLQGTNGDDLIKGRKGDDFITTGKGNDRVRGGRGDDIIRVDGTGDKRINGGKGHDTLELRGTEADYTVQTRQNGTTVYTAQDGSRIVARNIESVTYTCAAEDPVDEPDFTAVFPLASNDLGATLLEVTGDTATLTGPNGTNFTFTGVDASGLAVDGPIIATGGSGTINGEETTAVPLSPFSPAVLTVGSGFNPTGTQGVSAAFANGATLNTTVARNG